MINQAIEEAKKMRDEIISHYNTGDCFTKSDMETLSTIDDLIERLEKQPEQSRYEIAAEIHREWYITNTNLEFYEWLEKKKNNS